MPKLPEIVITAALIVLTGLVVSKGADGPRPNDLQHVMPATIQMMSDARDLPTTPFVGP